MKPSTRNVAQSLSVRPRCTVTLARDMLREGRPAGAGSIPKRITELRRDGFAVFGGQRDRGWCDQHDHAGQVATYWKTPCGSCDGRGFLPTVVWSGCGQCSGTGVERPSWALYLLTAVHQEPDGALMYQRVIVTGAALQDQAANLLGFAARDMTRNIPKDALPSTVWSMARARQ